MVSNASALIQQKNLSELTQEADTIVLGRVIKQEFYLEEGSNFTNVTILERMYLKGGDDREIVIKIPGGRAGDLVSKVDDVPKFENDEKVLLFLKKDHYGSIVGLRQGKYTIEDGRIKETGISLDSFLIQIKENITTSETVNKTATVEKGKSRPDIKIATAKLNPGSIIFNSDNDTGAKPEASKEVTISSPTWITLKYEGFEGAFPGSEWGIYGDPTWDDTNYMAYSGSWSGWSARGGTNGLDPAVSNYADNMNAWMIYGPIDLSDASDAAVTFSHWTRTEQNYDWFSYAASIDGSYFYGYDLTGDLSPWWDPWPWNDVTFDLKSVPTLEDLRGKPNVWIAFSFWSDPSYNDKGTFLDEIYIKKFAEPIVKLNGVIQDEYGSPLPGAVVKFTDCADNDVTSTTTPANGSFTLTAPVGSYKLKVVYNSITYTIPLNGIECYSYSYGSYTLTSPIQIPTKVHLTGTVQDEYGAAVANAKVKFVDSSGIERGLVYTGLDGSFALVAPPGTYKLQIDYNSITYTIYINGNEYNYYQPGYLSLSSPIQIAIKTTLIGFIQNEDGAPLRGAIVRFTTCSDSEVVSTVTDVDGSFSLRAQAGSYKLKVIYNSATYTIIINDLECYSYSPGIYSLSSPIKIPIKTTLTGSVQDEYGLPLSGVTVKFTTCSDSDVTSVITGADGSFTLTAPSGSYKLVLVYNSATYIIIINDQECYPYSVGSYSLSGPIRLPVQGKQGTIYVDVDNTNNYYNPMPWAKVYLDNVYQGTTDADGKKTLTALYGNREVKVENPSGVYCGTQSIYVDGAKYVYFDCSDATQKGDVLINLKVISSDTPTGWDYVNLNDRPIAKTYVYLDNQYLGLTDLAGQFYLNDVGYGTHNLDFYFNIIDPVYGEQTKWGRLALDVSASNKVLNIGVYDYQLSGSGAAGLKSNDGVSLQITNYTGSFTPEVVPVVAILVVINAVGTAWDAYNVYDCSRNYAMPDDINRWECWDEVGWLGVNFVPTGRISSWTGKLTVMLGKEVKEITKIGEIVKTVEKIGTNEFRVVNQYGGETIEYTVRYTDDGSEVIQITKNAVAVLVRNSNDAANAVKLVEKGSDSIQVGERVIKKGTISGTRENIQGELGEIMTDEYVTQITRSADKGIDIIVKSGQGTLKETDNYIFKFTKDGKNIKIFSKSGEELGEIDRLLEINGKPVIIETKIRRYNSMMEDISISKIDHKIEYITELYGGTKPEIVLQVPKGEALLGQVEMQNIVFNHGGEVIEFADDIERFQYIAGKLL
ncbi:MAG: carboxypeptidase regulatory-like domain-containing protein [Candidatus Methanoperedens sp.]|nr:carboxypeptidase regulatory-like domain-containing protein [Candidatus Methanoperedens sp.]